MRDGSEGRRPTDQRAGPRPVAPGGAGPRTATGDRAAPRTHPGPPGTRAAAQVASAYPIEPWAIREVALDPALIARNETLFALGNGHLGIRGTVEEESGNATYGTYVNGFYEESPIVYGETARGYAQHHQVLLNVADGTQIQLFVGDDPLDLRTGTVEAYERVLDLRAGVLARTVLWRSPAGHLVEVAARRLVSLARSDVAAIDYAVTLLQGSARLRIESAIVARTPDGAPSEDPRVGARLPDGALATLHREATGTRGTVVQRTRVTRLTVVAAMDHAVVVDGEAAGVVSMSAIAEADRVTFHVGLDARPGTRLRLTKTLAYCSSLDSPDEDLPARAHAHLAAARDRGFEALLAEQRAELDRFWRDSDVEIDGDDALQQGVRFNLFSLFQAAGRNGRTGLAAKGLTGEGYHGHYFWDTEIFAQPFFVYTQPAIARALLRFRCETLDKARERAAELSQRGALYPWRTIGGEEASAYFPAGTAQYHIDADIAYAFAKYVHATGDRTLLADGGAEVVFETARLWADLGAYLPSRGDAFCINEVTGPDEYTALVNNNCYTNMMARAHLRFAAALAAQLAIDSPDVHRRVAGRIGLTDAEVDGWRRAADRMRIPRDGALGIHAQDDSFLDREVWDFAGTPRSSYPLLLHYHPLVIYRHQVLKQPDVVLAQVLLGSEFTLSEKRRNFDYYDPLTTGDSSLSPCIQSVAANELGYAELAYAYFMRTARMDLDDVNGNVSHGVHIAAMAGSWVSLVYGFAGFRDDGGRTSFAPRLPDAWTRLRFRLGIRGSVVEVTVSGDAVTYELLAGDPVEIAHFGRPHLLGTDAPLTRSLEPRLDAVILALDGVVTRRRARHASAPRTPAEPAVAAAVDGLDDPGPEDVQPGIRGLLTDLRARGVRTAVISGDARAAEIVRALALDPLVDLVVGAAARRAPDPDAHLTVAEQLGVRWEDCVAIEATPAGVAAARAAGMVCVLVGDAPAASGPGGPSSADLTPEGLAGLFSAARTVRPLDGVS